MLREASPTTALPVPSPDQRVQVFELSLDAPFHLSEAWEVLSAAEQARASRFQQSALRARFVHGRATLRRLLGARLGADPESLTILVAEGGKPYLAGGSGLQFNVSHTAHSALFALSGSVRVGVDIEVVEAVVPTFLTASCYLDADEAAALAALPPAGVPAAFATLWTAKEALAKAEGSGLLRPLSSLRVREGRAVLGSQVYTVMPLALRTPFHVASLAVAEPG